MGRIRSFFLFLLQCISFSTPAGIITSMVVILLALAVLPTEFVLLSPSRCIFRQYILPFVFQNQCPSAGLFSDCLCPACGITRATSRLLHGDVDGAVAYNWLAIPVVIGMIAIAIVNVFRLRKN